MTWNNITEFVKTHKTEIVKKSLVVAGTAAGIILTVVLASKSTDDTIVTPESLDYIEPAEPEIENDNN